MLQILREYDIHIKDHLSIVEEDIENIIFSQIKNKKDFRSHKNESSLKFINIEGLFNKNDYLINFNDDINIFIAENGFGKTTILNIIVAILKGDKTRLKKLPFKSIEIGVNNEVIKIYKNELEKNILDKEDVEYILSEIKYTIPRATYERIYKNYIESKELDIDMVLHYIDRYSLKRDYYNENIREYIWMKRRRNMDDEKINNINRKLEYIKNEIKEEILYFPTYRRIEAEVENFANISEKKNRIYNSDSINFGMDDVESIINELTDKLKQDAINHYSIMNGEILDELLSEKSILKNNEKTKIDSDKINIVVGRIGKDRIKQLDKLMDYVHNNSSIVENEDFLHYYLLKLINIYESQKAIDEKIKRYRDICNKYLVNKEIVYDEVIAEVRIESKYDRDNISFKDLSSGEKQILSLFAKLYLSTSKNSIFIIDEPELSLSIIWQQKLIKDIYNSGQISMLIATTHSPYIFRNEYRVFAKELKVFRTKGDYSYEF